MIRPAWLLIAVAVFTGFIIVMAPASMVVGMFREDIARTVPGLGISNVKGSIWSGRSVLQYRDFPPVQAEWQLSALPLVAGTAKTLIQLEGPGLEADIDADFTGSSAYLNAGSAIVDASFINPATAAQGLSLTGTFTASNVVAGFSDGWITVLEGNVNWPGGIVHIQTPAQYYSAALPPLEGTLASQQDYIGFYLNDGAQRLVDLELKRDGWAKVDVSYDFMNLAGLPVPGADSQNGQASAVLIEEKIF